MSGAKIHFINSGLLSGSDSIRDELRSHWLIDESLEDTVGSSFSKMNNNIESGPAPSYGYGRIVNQQTIYSVLVDNTQITTASANSIVPTFQMPIRLVGNSENITDDNNWLQEVNKVFSYAKFTDTNFEMEIPYSPLYIKQTDYANRENYLVANFTYDYNFYVKEYQDYTSNFSDIKLIPNYYSLLSGYLGYQNENEDMLNYISLEKTYPIKRIFNDANTSYPPTHDIDRSNINPLTKKYIDELEIIKSYLSGSFVNTEVSSSSTSFASATNGVMFFNKHSQEKLFDSSFKYKHKMPFYTKLGLPYDITASRTFGDMIIESGFENLMLTHIKEKFIDQHSSNNDETSYTALTTLISSSADTVSEKTNLSTTRLPTIDLFSVILEKIIDSNNNSLQGFYIAGDQEESRQKIINFNGRSRYDHTVPSLKLLNNVNDYLNSNFPLSPDLTDPSMEEILDLAGTNRHSEIIAYRIEKLAYRAAPNVLTDAAVSEAPLQNFLIFNSENLIDSSDTGQDFVFYDTQVQYGREYHYNVYAYVLVFGYNYSYDNLVVSRQIAHATGSDGSLVYCLEFYNPGSGETASRLSAISGITGVSRFENNLFTDAQDSSIEPYLADFNFKAEPAIKIVEVPMYAKSITVMDHPLQGVDTYNFQRMDDSQIIGFLANLEASSPAQYPKTLTPEETYFKSIYLNSNDLLETEEIEKTCKSKPNVVQVFRKNSKPNAIDNFDMSHFISEKSLSTDNSNYKLSNCIYEEKVLTNRKYYYILRFVSENITYGQLSNVIEAELVDDGGYLYSLFEEYSDSDFEEQIPSAIAEEFKKIFHLRPNVGQLAFDDSSVDYTNNAYEEIQNLTVGAVEESIFNKTFKIRLTSKKTGKKIDLNVTYKLNNM